MSHGLSEQAQVVLALFPKTSICTWENQDPQSLCTPRTMCAVESCVLPDTHFLSREGILKTAKALVEDTKVLVQNATASQEKLAQAAQSSVSTITRLAEVVKLGAASLGSEDPETQVCLG